MELQTLGTGAPLAALPAIKACHLVLTLAATKRRMLIGFRRPRRWPNRSRPSGQSEAHDVCRQLLTDRVLQAFGPDLVLAE